METKEENKNSVKSEKEKVEVSTKEKNKSGEVKIENNEEVKVDSLKAYIKNLVKNEACLRSISFSYNEENKEFICYFAWEQGLYNKFFVERDVIRKNVISYLSKYNFKLNKKKSNASKYVFNG